MRAFVAIDIPEDVRRRIADLLQALRPVTDRVRWTRPEGLHITLKFIGELAPEQVESVQAQLASVGLHAPLSLQVRGIGYFPNERSPRVIWLGISSGPELAELAGQMEGSLEAIGIPRENRPFSSHLTLGRLRTPGKILAVKETLRRCEPLEFGSFTANEFYLYESRLSPAGSIYRRLAHFPISSAGSIS
ncbi:MAG: RNA 2',3'-cyclic phosphodiesterase [Acidobacteria bacterium]|nr:RNA 2',3'-cyclic phosphodiesterase [Acidobacteriota bacterium]